jgi:hypothetical protein
VSNEFCFYCLKRHHKLQSLESLKPSSNDLAAVVDHFSQQYAPIAATGSLPEIPAKNFYSKELVAYLTAMLSTARTPRPATPASTASWTSNTMQPSIACAV